MELRKRYARYILQLNRNSIQSSSYLEVRVTDKVEDTVAIALKFPGIPVAKTLFSLQRIDAA
jgi:hypothetical protein